MTGAASPSVTHPPRNLATVSFPLPSTLTPSKLGRFVNCPLAFRYSYIEHLPEPASIYQLRGTLVHVVLQQLFAEVTPCERTPERARAILEAAWPAFRSDDEFLALELDEAATASFLREIHSLLARYFALEDPTQVRPVGVELDLHAEVDGIDLHGIIDRLDHLPDGRFVLVDYKTGRSPRAERSRSRLTGVQFYALLCERVLGVRPSEVRLMYLGDQVVVVDEPTDQSMRGLRQRATAVWAAIERACATEDFRPNPSPLCKTCAFRGTCPAVAAESNLVGAAR